MEPIEYIATFNITVQTSEDTWDVVQKVMKCNEQTRLFEIISFYKKYCPDVELNLKLIEISKP